jgi:hypothetical protein
MGGAECRNPPSDMGSPMHPMITPPDDGSPPHRGGRPSYFFCLVVGRFLVVSMGNRRGFAFQRKGAQGQEDLSHLFRIRDLNLPTAQRFNHLVDHRDHAPHTHLLPGSQLPVLVRLYSK